ncbi:monofunctional biosynthetic peptidoglycan transglycosylase [Altibacter sp. HG106]|uniref:monofunctional biosynthetic peptidoglycan transglycosylase n=1 Tax=Altibacter sp. HG106 TaxID=3023937 RepID=UPI00235051AF|nr:monofunctional biosynthetic peptidoglycan transglycosylase [Altibacter sp. HG106]MDC7994943.1 monofunctional biosynthetic peptidoglycan transglycosylase [Altibacter sp. HG106]
MIKRLFTFILKAIGWFVVLSLLWVVLYKYVPVPYTPLMAIRSLSEDDYPEIQHEWKAIEDIAVAAQLAVVCSEDQHFIRHNGFDYEAIKKAYEKNREGKRLRGGSTISQQTAKNVFLWPERSWLRKGLEAYFTFLIEQLWSKERILEVYLNSIEMGEGVFGVEAAAQYWFQKSAKELTTREASLIAAVLPNPRTYRANPASNYIQKRSSWIQRQMKNYGSFSLNPKPDDSQDE